MKLVILTPGATDYTILVAPLAVVGVTFDGDPSSPVTADGGGVAVVPIPEGALLVSVDEGAPSVAFLSIFIVGSPVNLGPSWGLASTTTDIMAGLRKLSLAIFIASEQTIGAVNTLQMRFSTADRTRLKQPYAPKEVLGIDGYFLQIYSLGPNAIVRDATLGTPVVRCYDTRGNVLAEATSTHS